MPLIFIQKELKELRLSTRGRRLLYQGSKYRIRPRKISECKYKFSFPKCTANK